MNYIDSIRDFFLSPKWLTNLLLAGLCSLIPVVGPMVVLGWLLGGFWGRGTYQAAAFPDFDFSRFGDYLTRGLWPMVVALVAGVVIAPVMWLICFVPLMGMGVLAGGHGRQGSEAAALVMVPLMVGAVLVVTVVFGLLLKPLMLRAALLQDFPKAFDFGWALRFLKYTWLECVLATVFLWLASLALALVGLMALCVGIYFVSGPVYFAMAHLDRQLYLLFLERGGDALELSPKLREGPPAIPAPPPPPLAP
jgi:hypothetical protein